MLVGVFSGLVFSGKSFFRNWVMGLPEYKDAVFVSADAVRNRLYGDRSDTHITKTEHVFKNEVTRSDVKTKLIVERPPAVFLEMVMLTREAHQRPFVEMVESANLYLQTIEQEEVQRDGKPVPESSVKVDFKCVYFYCDLETVKRRVGYRQRELETCGNVTNASVFDLNGFLRGAQQIEIPPVGYTPLYLNTSDESEGALYRQHEEVLSFLRGEMPVDEKELERREAEAIAFLEQARQL
ncbi:MAG: hypothetical protein A3G05_02190 [Candidatus Zambryskibacteria bacterium RIFCSPLOWO2_12_FULL_45_14]|nr:MAG: hypothetical protein A3G05_02190 [Candidatus Zambryskibacteria bacterium RIFCSPLOWO2_12_FULL_45_14]